MNRFPQAGRNNATTPVSAKQIPITGTTATENAPPVMMPVPYSSNHAPGNALTIPKRNNAIVKTAPAANGGRKLNANFRPGPLVSANPARCAFRRAAHKAMLAATTASTSQIDNQCRDQVGRDASKAARSAVAPIATCPHPGTAVNDDDRSMVSRMNRKSSIAREGTYRE